MNITQCVRRVLGAGLWALGASAPLGAAPVTFTFQGAVTQVSVDPTGPLAGLIGPGSPILAYLNFDTAAPDADASPQLGSYTFSGFPFGVAPIVGPVVFLVMHAVNISVVDGVAGVGPDLYSVFAWEGSAGGLGDYFSLSLLLEDDTGSAFSSDALPSGLPELSRFSTSTLLISGQYTDLNQTFVQYEIQGRLLPEPATFSLVALALSGCVAAGRRQWRAAVPQESPTHSHRRSTS